MTTNNTLYIDSRLSDEERRQALYAPLVDAACAGTTMRDYLKATDLTHLPEDIIAQYDDGTAHLGHIRYATRR